MPEHIRQINLITGVREIKLFHHAHVMMIKLEVGSILRDILFSFFAPCYLTLGVRLAPRPWSRNCSENVEYMADSGKGTHPQEVGGGRVVLLSRRERPSPYVTFSTTPSVVGELRRKLWSDTVRRIEWFHVGSYEMFLYLPSSRVRE